MIDNGRVRAWAKVLGWAATALLVVVSVGYLLVKEAAPDMIGEWLGDVFDPPVWVAWLIVGVALSGCVVALAYFMFGRQPRALRRARRERMHRLREFDLDE